MCRRAFSFSKKPVYEKRRAKGFRPPFFGTRQSGTGMAFAGSFKGQNGFRKRAQEDAKPFWKRPRGTPFLQPAIHPLFSRKALRRLMRRRAVLQLHIADKIWHSLVGRRPQHAYGREQPRNNTPRIPQRTQTPPHGGRGAAAHGFPPAAVYAVHNKRSAPPAALPAAHGLSGPRAASAAFPSDTAAFRLFPPSDAPLTRENGCHSAHPR